MKKEKKKWLIIVFLLLIIVTTLIGGVGILLFKKENTKNIYYEFIDYFANNLINENNILNNEYGTTGNIKANITTQDKNLKRVEDIINNLDINIDSNLNYPKRLANTSLEFKYKKDNLLDLNLYLNKENTYLNIANLYDKTINLNINTTWNEQYKIIFTNIPKIIKKSLTKEYFTVNDENLNFQNKIVKTKKYTLTLKDNDFYNVGHNFLTELKNNKKLLQALKEITKKSENEIIDDLYNYFSDLENTNNILIINTYLYKDKLIKININYNEQIVNIINNSHNTFEISINNKVIGNLIINDFNYKLNLDYNNYLIDLEITKEKDESNLKLNIKNNDEEINITTNKKDKKTIGKFQINSNKYQTNLILNFNFTKKDNVIIKDIDLNNIIDIKDMQDSDFNKIIINASKNKTILNLIQDIQKIFS